MAVGIIIGAAFGKIITSLVNDVIMPPIGLILGRVNFADLFFSLDGKTYANLAAAKAASAPTINYGMFLNNVLDFAIVAFVMFLMIRQFNRLMPPVVPPVTTHECPFCAKGTFVGGDGRDHRGHQPVKLANHQEHDERDDGEIEDVVKE